MKPVVGNWYQEGSRKFAVIAVDDEEGTIEIQDIDGDVDEMEREDWDALVENATLSEIDEPGEESEDDITDVD